MRKKIIIEFIILIELIICIYIGLNYVYLKKKNKTAIEKNDILLAQELSNSPFTISKIILYSSGYGKNKNKNFQKANWILDIYEYTDIALYITSKQAIKSLSISNFNAEKGKLYYLDSTKFGTEEILENYEINSLLEYTVLNDSNEDNLINYNTPIFFADSSNPITLKFVNTVAKDFIIENNERLQFDGTLLEKTNTKLQDLKLQISFNINIETYNKEKYFNTVYIDIPIENNSTNIFSGSIFKELKNIQMQFFRKE